MINNENFDKDYRFFIKKTCEELSKFCKLRNKCVILMCQTNRTLRTFENPKDIDETVVAESSDITRPSDATIVIKQEERECSKGIRAKHQILVNVKTRNGQVEKAMAFDYPFRAYWASMNDKGGIL